MLQKLDDMYKRENVIIQQTKKLKLEWEQLRDDTQILEQLIMYQSNKNKRTQTGDKNG